MDGTDEDVVPVASVTTGEHDEDPQAVFAGDEAALDDDHAAGPGDDAGPSSPLTGDVVDMDVAEAEDASHHAPQLVEGDFFPSESPADVEAELAEADEEMKALVTEASPSAAFPATAPVAVAVKEDTGATLARRRRVQWADSASPAHGAHRRALIKHVTSFYMPQSGHRDREGGRTLPGFGGGASADTGLFPEPVAASAAAVALFKERQNTNGEPYLFCRAQRIAPHFVAWKREAHQPLEVPFTAQPAAPPVDARPPTLFAALYPAAPTVATPASARTLTVTMNIHNNLQMPFMRPDKVFDEPFTFAT